MESVSNSRRGFINRWIAGRTETYECVVDQAEQAPQHITAELALRNIAEDNAATPTDGVLTIGCRACDGGVKLIMEGAGLEAESCRLREAMQQNRAPVTPTDIPPA